MSQNDDIKQLEKVLGYKFRNTKLLELSVTHASYTRSHKNSYQRLEFLGDAVISLVVAEFLIKKFPDLDEGELTNIRQQMISQTSLANAAKILGLDKFVRADEKITTRNISDSILCDIFEAVVGAIYLDGGIKFARKFIEKNLLAHMEVLTMSPKLRNYKGELLEYLQAMGKTPSYELLSEVDSDGEAIFAVGVRINGEILGVGVGRRKKDAEQEASRKALEKLKSKSSQ